MTPKGIFVAGTDTDAGKTVVSAALVAAMKKRSLDASYQKCVGTEGISKDGGLYNPDAVWIKQAAQLEDNLSLVNPLCFSEPLTPLAAARRENRFFGLEELREKALEIMRLREIVVFEGAGGLLAPLSENKTMLDLIKVLDLPVLLVGRPGLGTINHTLLSLRELAREQVLTVGYCLSGLKPEQANDPSVSLNPGLINEYTKTPYLGTLPWLDRLGEASFEELAALAENNLDLTKLLTGTSA
ncbi:dethiobiotin synthase [Dethiosulfatarculus sandiegensis]|uniref:ATP-dependent dethiobiotin synthetase BioD n=1 Tax=Dethiosulfatarculus sandiegensis TaxID=1429043 RepID=A0A0D2GK73_9BACT|nr:dethiobiotin synthase [Dethiosulfatarculus sandiegensis]KIX15167.1 ATP-dependent dethiobiotin synthetase BioD [Dethiosulfatarculus sandiegensis]